MIRRLTRALRWRLHVAKTKATDAQWWWGHPDDWTDEEWWAYEWVGRRKPAIPGWFR